ncbi:MAG: sulfatase-like hydrolase/transferase [Myxococcota bacterium]|nr:sulfatase-like hydrolase/transferase [Myxococcota bacterium]
MLGWSEAVGWMRSSKPPLLAGLVCFFGLVAVSSAFAEPPNIVLIMADDLGWRDVGFHGSEIMTPNIDRLAQEGVALERFYVQPICSPTRAELMTGKSSARLGVVQPISKLDPMGLPIGEKILPQYLGAAGYQSLMVGKWHLGHREKRYFPQARGFEHFYGHVTGGIGYWDHNHGGGHDWQRNGVTVREEGYSTRLIADEAVRLLDARDRERPLFLFASFNAPHLPNEAPESALNAYPENLGSLRRLHAGMVAELDTAIGRILAKLESEGLTGNTLVWFFSDNGGLNPSAGPPGLLGVVEFLTSVLGEPLPGKALEFLRTNTLDGASDNAPLRAGKGSVYEGGIRVPSVIRWPGHLAPGISETFVTARDVLPTLLQAAGRAAAIPAGLDGSGRLSAILESDTSADGMAGVGDYRVQGMTGVALIRPPWKLVLVSAGPFSDPVPELYQIYDDPHEEKDLAAGHSERVANLLEALEAWPLGPEVHASLGSILLDPDAFGGGEEDREPWAEAAD